MKKVLLILLVLISVSSAVNAQGNLQFNQVVITDFTANFGGWSNNTATTITVPAGKVWKVEQADLWINNSYRNSGYGAFSLYIDNIVVRKHKASTVNQYPDRLPVWLPAGTYNIIISNENSSTYNYTGTINAIEFNVIP